MTKTEQYQLNQWDPEDKVLREDFCEDNRKIETALAGLKTDKAEQTALEALAGQVTTLEQGRLVYKFDSYIGTGELGQKTPNRLEFDFKPLLLIVSSGSTYGGYPWIRVNRARVSETETIPLTWEENAVSWSASGTAAKQLNIENGVYYYLAIGVPL